MDEQFIHISRNTLIVYNIAPVSARENICVVARIATQCVVAGKTFDDILAGRTVDAVFKWCSVPYCQGKQLIARERYTIRENNPVHAIHVRVITQRDFIRATGETQYQFGATRHWLANTHLCCFKSEYPQRVGATAINNDIASVTFTENVGVVTAKTIDVVVTRSGLNPVIEISGANAVGFCT